MKLVAILFILAAVHSCQSKLTVHDSCAVIKATLYNDGKLTFTDAEIDGLSESNQQKLVAVKQYYKTKCLS